MFKEKPFYLDDNYRIPYGSSYLFYNLGGTYPQILSFNSGTRHQNFQASVPLASSIEATMEWLDRVATSQFIPHFGTTSPLTSTGFEWERYNGEAYESFIPGTTGEGLKGYPIHTSGTWGKFMENLEFARDATILGQEGTTLNNMNYYRVNSNTVGETSLHPYVDLKNPKIAKTFYHNFIPNLYKAVPLFAGFGVAYTRGGTINDTKIVNTGDDVYNHDIMVSSYVETTGSPVRGYSSLYGQNIGKESVENFFRYDLGIATPLSAGTFSEASDYIFGSSTITEYLRYTRNNGTKDVSNSFVRIGSPADSYAGVIGTVSKYSAGAETHWDYVYGATLTSAGPPIVIAMSGIIQFGGSGNSRIRYTSSHSHSASFMLYPVNKNSLSSVTEDTQALWPRSFTYSSGNKALPFNVITGLDTGILNTHVRHITDIMHGDITTSGIADLEHNRGNIELRNNFSPKIQVKSIYTSRSSVNTDIIFAYGFTTHHSGSLYNILPSYLIYSIENGDYTTLPVLSTTVISSGQYAIPYGGAMRPELIAPIPSQYYGIDSSTDNFPRVAVSYLDKRYSIDLSPAFVSVPPDDAEFLFIAMFSNPFMNNTPSNLGPLIVESPEHYAYSPSGNLFGGSYTYINRVGSSMYELNGYDAVAPSIFDNIGPIEDVSGPIPVIISPTSGHSLKSIQNDAMPAFPAKATNGSNINGSNPCMFEVVFPHHCYSTRVSPGFLANGASGQLITDVLLSTAASGYVPMYGTMYGF